MLFSKNLCSFQKIEEHVFCKLERELACKVVKNVYGPDTSSVPMSMILLILHTHQTSLLIYTKSAMILKIHWENKLFKASQLDKFLV